jgi:hypothetical protein
MAVLAWTASTATLAPVPLVIWETIARPTSTTAIQLHVRMAARVLTASIAILAPVQKDSKGPTARSMLTALRICVRMTALVMTASIAILVPGQKDPKESIARSMLTTALRIRV